MQVSHLIPQLRTTDLSASIRFYTAQAGFTLEFQYEDFYAGIRVGRQLFHLKLADVKDPSIEFVDNGGHFHLYFDTDDAVAAAAELKSKGVRLVADVHETAWGTREFAVKDDQGHTLYFGERR
jgi:catechol 2,3-dioxygenase-like lactoylglutathione lyase family enzyme